MTKGKIVLLVVLAAACAGVNLPRILEEEESVDMSLEEGLESTDEHGGEVDPMGNPLGGPGGADIGSPIAAPPETVSSEAAQPSPITVSDSAGSPIPGPQPVLPTPVDNDTAAIPQGGPPGATAAPQHGESLKNKLNDRLNALVKLLERPNKLVSKENERPGRDPFGFDRFGKGDAEGFREREAERRRRMEEERQARLAREEAERKALAEKQRMAALDKEVEAILEIPIRAIMKSRRGGVVRIAGYSLRVGATIPGSRAVISKIERDHLMVRIEERSVPLYMEAPGRRRPCGLPLPSLPP